MLIYLNAPRPVNDKSPVGAVRGACCFAFVTAVGYPKLQEEHGEKPMGYQWASALPSVMLLLACIASLRTQTASIVEGGLVAILYVTLTIPGTSRMISRASVSRVSNGSRVGTAVRASTLSQQRTSIC